MILTIPVLLYQLFFVFLLYVASKLGKKALTLCTILCLLWTATHIFLVPLAVLQTIVILISFATFRQKIAAKERAGAT